MPSAHNYLQAIENYVPGKAKINGNNSQIIKLSSNENALGSSPYALKEYHKHADKIFRYADGSCEELRKKLANKYQINSDQIVCGAGSDELIALITSAYAGKDDEIIYSQYGFLMYPISIKRVGAKPVQVKELDLKCDVKAIVKAITDKTKIIFIANPNNPTGSYLSGSEVEWLIANTRQDILIVLDHAYEEFVIVSDYPQIIPIINKNKNVIMLRTFSKIYGLASLRLGWCYCSIEIAEILNKVRGPFNVGGPAQQCGIASIDDEQFYNSSVSHNSKWLAIYFKEIAELSQVKAHPSVANFILLDFMSEEKCQKAQNLFLENSIILREMKPYRLNNCLRLTIGQDFENDKVLTILKNNFK